MTAPQRDPAGGKRPDPSSIDTRHVSAQTIEIIKETEKQNDTDFPCLRQLHKSINNNPNMIEFIQIRLCFASGKKKNSRKGKFIQATNRFSGDWQTTTSPQVK